MQDGKLHKKSRRKIRRIVQIARTVRLNRRRTAENKCLRGVCPSEVFLVYTILSRAVLSQSTQPAKPIGFHTPRAANPPPKSYNASLSSSRAPGICVASYGWWLVVVEISATLFQPARSGSHLYSAPLHPVRSRTLSSRSYSPLVGLATPLLPCIPHLHPYYITRMGICQEVFSKSLWKTLKVFPSTTHPSGRASHLLTPLLYHKSCDLSIDF